jgi:hypothetical protein
MEKSSQIAWKIVPLRHFFPLKVVPLIEVLLYLELGSQCPEQLLPLESALTSLLHSIRILDSPDTRAYTMETACAAKEVDGFETPECKWLQRWILESNSVTTKFVCS